MDRTTEGPRPRSLHRPALRLVHSSSGNHGLSALNPPTVHAPSTESPLSLTAGILQAAPVEVGSVEELLGVFSRNFGSVQERHFLDWIDRLPDPKNLLHASEQVRRNVSRVVQALAGMSDFGPSVKFAAITYLRELRSHNLVLLSSKTPAA